MLESRQQQLCGLRRERFCWNQKLHVLFKILLSVSAEVKTSFVVRDFLNLYLLVYQIKRNAIEASSVHTVNWNKLVVFKIVEYQYLSKVYDKIDIATFQTK